MEITKINHTHNNFLAIIIYIKDLITIIFEDLFFIFRAANTNCEIRAVNTSCEHELRTRAANTSCEHELRTRAANTGCELLDDSDG
jgi:hypothetical protein